MPIVAAVLHAFPDRVSDVIRDLSADPRITVGVGIGDRIPVVADTTSRDDDKQLWRTIEARPDVRFLELAYADFSDIHPQGV